jgi:hypothetical protein
MAAQENPERLRFAGSVDPATGYPLWFEDANGLRLELVLNNDPLAPVIGELPDPAGPFAFPDNFPDESFYFSAEAELEVGGTGVVGRARIILALEAAFGGAGAPVPGANVVFARIRVRMDDLIPGATYVVTHPYGVTGDMVADDRGRVFETLDLGIAENNTAKVVDSGQVAPFLSWDNGAPAGYVGDGVTAHRITGSPFGTNFVRIEGPGVGQGVSNTDPADPLNTDKVFTDLFSVQGRIAKRMGVDARSAVYTKSGASTFVDVHAASVPGQAIELAGSDIRIPLVGSGRDYVGRAQVAARPATLDLVNTGDVPPTRVTIKPVDLVTVESAVHDVQAQTLTVKAHSSDPAAVLTLQPLGLAFAAPEQVFNGIAATPAVITLVSDKGGLGRQAVALAGGAAANLGVVASAVPPARAIAGEAFALDGSGSLLATAFQWTKTTGGAGNLTQATSAIASFVPTTAGNFQFKLTVQGPGGPDDALVDVTVSSAPPPDMLTIDLAEYRTGRGQFRVSGQVSNSPNEVIVSIGGFELGRGVPDVTGAWSVRRALLGSEQAHVPTIGSQIDIVSNTGAITAPVQIRN